MHNTEEEVKKNRKSNFLPLSHICLYNWIEDGRLWVQGQPVFLH